MSESNVIKKFNDKPITVNSLKNDLKALGIYEGITVLVHSSLSSIGWVCGASVAVIQALEETIGDEGTLIMPAHSGEISEPKLWQNPPVPETWWKVIRDNMPAFDVNLTPTRGLGKIPECFRSGLNVKRSYHPQVSFTAKGKNADYITQDHSLDYGLGEKSPLRKIYELDGWVLFLGTTHQTNTSMHLAEYKANYQSKKIIENGASIIKDGKRTWVTIQDVNITDEDFPSIGKEYNNEFSNLIKKGKVGNAECLLFPQRSVVDFAVEWMEKHR